MRCLFLLLTLPLFGAYVGNPADPAIMNTGFFTAGYPYFKLTSGYIYDYTSNKRYGTDQIEPDFDPDQALKRFGLHSQLASFSLIFIERFQVFGSAGGSKESVTEGEQPDWADIVFDFESAYQFAWSAGAKAILIQWGQTYFSADFTYFAIPSSSKTFFKYLNRLNLPMHLDAEKQKLSLDEWQISLGLSSRFYFLTPYVGANYLRSRLHVQEGPDIPSINYHNEVSWGYFYGLTLSLTGRFHLNFERRMRDEFAYTFSTIAVF
ncbi:MAG TPA: hypothetical protein VLF94_04070 [Chlamydiales bacterium]|nr:hypothetical protein [Chlamydiales bacterium]